MRRGGYLSLGIKDIFDPKGRIDRLTFFFYGAILRIITIIIGAAVLVPLTLIENVPQIVIDNADLVRWGILLPLLYGQFCVCAKRLHDLGLPAILGLLYFADHIALLALTLGMTFASLTPEQEALGGTIVASSWLVTLGTWVLLQFVPGKRGPNKYGVSSTGEDRPRAHVLEG